MRKSLRMMRKSMWPTGAALLAVAAMSSIALAAVNVKSEPTASFSGATVTLTGGEFSGLGNIEAKAELTVTGSATYTCTNPQGHASPGQNPVPAQPGSSGEVGLGNSEHNGRGTISNLKASVTEPKTPSAKQVGCGGTGSTKWSVTLDSLIAEAAHLEITQRNKLVFCRNYTLGGPASGTAC
ncbi:MAG: hypothetical protein QOI89_1615 [Solirubrobacteraceae bacterium]|nr:hypothetical protein [Solirubrobacteraceae bacterium]